MNSRTHLLGWPHQILTNSSFKQPAEVWMGGSAKRLKSLYHRAYAKSSKGDCVGALRDTNSFEGERILLDARFRCMSIYVSIDIDLRCGYLSV